MKGKFANFCIFKKENPQQHSDPHPCTRPNANREDCGLDAVAAAAAAAALDDFAGVALGFLIGDAGDQFKSATNRGTNRGDGENGVEDFTRVGKPQVGEGQVGDREAEANDQKDRNEIVHLEKQF